MVNGDDIDLTIDENEASKGYEGDYSLNRHIELIVARRENNSIY